MGESTGIAWTDSTINVWHGCDKVSAGCKHCYAEVSTPVRVKAARGLKLWGPGAARDETKAWLSDLRRWGRAVVRTASGGPWRVFGQSLSDTFEDRRDLDPHRGRFFAAMTEWHCRSLTFQLLTKRPENVLRMVPPAWLTSWPAHVWIGCTVEDQENADRRLPYLARIPAAVRFVSIEPQIGPVNISRWLRPRILETNDGRWMWNTDPGVEREGGTWWWGVDWAIQGGESGSKARPFDLAWARSMREQCRAAGVPFFLKQLGAYVRGEDSDHLYPFNVGGCTYDRRRIYDRFGERDLHGGDESEWPADLRGCRAFPEAHG